MPAKPQASLGANLLRRIRRRTRLRSRAESAPVWPTRALAVFHLADTSGPSRSLEAELGWLGGEVDLDVVFPGSGNLEAALGPVADVTRAEYEALTAPSRGRGGASP